MDILQKVNRPSLKKDYLNQVKRLRQLSKKPSSKVSGLISLTIFTVAFFGIFAIMPTFQTIANLRREIEDAELVNQKLNQKIKALQKAEEIFEQEDNNLKLVNKILPEEASFERLAWQLEWLALNRGVQLVNGGFNEFPLVTTESVKEKQAIEVELSIVGSYPNIKEFIKSLAQVDRLITISDVTINSKKLKRGEEAISATIKLSASYLPIATDLGL